MSDVKFTVTTKAPPEAVSAYLADARHSVEWVKNLDRVEVVSGEPGAAGTRYEVFVKGGFGSTRSTDYEFTEVTGTRLRAISRLSNADGHETVELIPVAGGGTEVHYLGELTLHGVSKLATPFVGFLAHQNIDQDALVERLDGLVAP